MKTRLVMKRISEVQPGDIMVGREGWKTLESIRPVIRITKPFGYGSKITLEYKLEDRPNIIGKIRRWPNFYVICVKRLT